MIDNLASIGYNTGMIDSQFFSLILSERFRSLQPDVAFTYLLLRSDIHLGHTGISVLHRGNGEYVSGLSVQTIAQHLHAPDVTVHRCLADLRKRRWIKEHADGHQLGEQDSWYVDSPPGQPTRVGEHPDIDKVRRAAGEGKALLQERSRKSVEIPPDIREQILGDLIQTDPIERETLRHKFYDKHLSTFGKPPDPPKSSHARSAKSQMNTYVDRALRYCGSLSETVRIIDFIFDNWSDIRSSRITAKETPTWSLIGGKTFLRKMQLAEVHGFEYFSDYGIRDICNYFYERHKEIWGYPPKELTSSDYESDKRGAQAALVGRALKEFGGDGARLMKIIDFLFDNYEALKEKHSWAYTSPGWPMFGSIKLLLFLESQADEKI